MKGEGRNNEYEELLERIGRVKDCGEVWKEGESLMKSDGG